MENDAIVVAIPDMAEEVFHGFGSVLGEETQLNGSPVGAEFDGRLVIFRHGGGRFVREVRVSSGGIGEENR